LIVDEGNSSTGGETLPGLTINQAGNSLVITWTSTPGAVLQFTPSLSSPNWQTVTATPTTSNGVTTQVIVPVAQTGFYRLFKSQ
jgi:hypothetical protein